MKRDVRRMEINSLIFLTELSLKKTTYKYYRYTQKKRSKKIAKNVLCNVNKIDV